MLKNEDMSNPNIQFLLCININANLPTNVDHTTAFHSLISNRPNLLTIFMNFVHNTIMNECESN
jgi:hypothetical protein